MLKRRTVRRMRNMRKRIRKHSGYLKTIAVNTHSASYELVGRARHRIKATSQYLSCIAGHIWVTMGDTRLSLKAGDKLKLDDATAESVDISVSNRDAAYYTLTHR